MIVKGKHVAGPKLQDDDFFREYPVLWDKWYIIQLEVLSREMEKELERTARYCNTRYQQLSEDSCSLTISAAGAIRWAREALCPNLVPGWDGLIKEVFTVLCELEPKIYPYLLHDCRYRGGICYKEEQCAMSKRVIMQFISMVPENIYRDARNEAILNKVKVDAGLIH